ncbi:hypothetical protein ABW21_db0200097 [Orbilia brochopaga]|nr:hypothetical protein ABW21_db0200097 [Drechslerella brochopaga]
MFERRANALRKIPMNHYSALAGYKYPAAADPVDKPKEDSAPETDESSLKESPETDESSDKESPEIDMEDRLAPIRREEAKHRRNFEVAQDKKKRQDEKDSISKQHTEGENSDVPSETTSKDETSRLATGVQLEPIESSTLKQTTLATEKVEKRIARLDVGRIRPRMTSAQVAECQEASKRVVRGILCLVRRGMTSAQVAACKKAQNEGWEGLPRICSEMTNAQIAACPESQEQILRDALREQCRIVQREARQKALQDRSVDTKLPKENMPPKAIENSKTSKKASKVSEEGKKSSKKDPKTSNSPQDSSEKTGKLEGKDKHQQLTLSQQRQLIPKEIRDLADRLLKPGHHEENFTKCACWGCVHKLRVEKHDIESWKLLIATKSPTIWENLVRYYSSRFRDSDNEAWDEMVASLLIRMENMKIHVCDMETEKEVLSAIQMFVRIVFRED